MKKYFLLTAVPVALGLVIYYFYPESKLPPNAVIDKLVIHKSERTLQVFSNNRVIKTYRVALGRNPIGKKEQEGDKKTPEGTYLIDAKNPGSGFHKNLGISYPNKDDIEHAKRNHVQPGSNIKIHGLRNGFGFIGKFHRLIDWTAGCIALTDEEVDELYERVPVGTPVVIFP